MIQEFTSKRGPRDLKEVSQFGYLDLRVAYTQGTISGDLNGQDPHFNNIEDPSSILGKPKDVFDSYRLANTVKSREGIAKSRSSVTPSGNNSTE